MSRQSNLRTWRLAIISSRETAQVLQGAIRAAIAACEGEAATIDVLVNGNTVLAQETAAFVPTLCEPASSSVVVRVWSVPMCDKANAINLCIHEISPAADVTFFIDGYVEVMPNSLRLLADGLERDVACLAATGVPSCGPSAAKVRKLLLNEGGLHGNLVAVRGSVMQELRARRFRLPVGLYRTDSLLGALFSFGLDPSRHTWDAGRVLVHPDATWRTPQQPILGVQAVVARLRRRQRQARGMLEIRAFRQHLDIEKRSPESLPLSADELIVSWAERCKREARRLCLRNWLCLRALRAARTPRDISAMHLPVKLVAGPGPHERVQVLT